MMIVSVNLWNKLFHGQEMMKLHITQSHFKLILQLYFWELSRERHNHNRQIQGNLITRAEAHNSQQIVHRNL